MKCAAAAAIRPTDSTVESETLPLAASLFLAFQRPQQFPEAFFSWNTGQLATTAAVPWPSVIMSL